MPVSVQISDEQITSPAVARALADLMLALSGEPAQPARLAYAPAPTAAAPPAQRRRTARKGRKAPAKKPSWTTFEAGLSPQTRTFIGLVQRRGRLTMTDARSELGLKAKGIGGMTGALSRKAQSVGMELPFSAGKTRSGQRMWAWRPKAAAELGVAALAAAPAAPSTGAPAPAASPTASPKAPKASKAAGKAKARPSWTQFEADLSAQTKSFLELVRTSNTLSMDGAKEALSLPGKALGGLTGALTRKANNAGISLPFSQGRSSSGQRLWIWQAEAPASSPAPSAPATADPAAKTKGRTSFLREGPAKRKPATT